MGGGAAALKGAAAQPQREARGRRGEARTAGRGGVGSTPARAPARPCASRVLGPPPPRAPSQPQAYPHRLGPSREEGPAKGWEWVGKGQEEKRKRVEGAGGRQAGQSRKGGGGLSLVPIGVTHSSSTAGSPLPPRSNSESPLPPSPCGQPIQSSIAVCQGGVGRECRALWGAGLRGSSGS